MQVDNLGTMVKIPLANVINMLNSLCHSDNTLPMEGEPEDVKMPRKGSHPHTNPKENIGIQ
jgi:hypothetical protein